MRILVVDDEPDFLATCVRLFALIGHEAVTATDALAAISTIDAGGLDLVITDLRIGPLGGQAIVRHLQRVQPALPLIVVTAHPSPEVVQVVRQARAILLSKPVSPAELKAAIERIQAR